MSTWSRSTTYTLPDGTVKSGFYSLPSEIPQAAKDSGRWVQCLDRNWHWNLFWFRNPAGDQMYQLVSGKLQPVAGGPVLKPGFLDIYGPEPGPRGQKAVWLQALSTFIDDQLPFGVTRSQASSISEKLEPYGMPGVRFFRLQRKYVDADSRILITVLENRIVFVHELSEVPNVRYQDYPSNLATDPTLTDDLAAAWQTQLSIYDPGSLPPFAALSGKLDAGSRKALEDARSGNT